MGITQVTLRETRAERILAFARAKGRHDADSRLRDIDLQRALEIDPANPLIMWDRAIFLLNEQKRFFSERQFNLMSIDKLEEALDLLERAEGSYHFPPSLNRTHGEAASMLAELYRHLGDDENLDKWREVSFQSLFLAAEKLPRPRDRRESFNASLILAAQSMGRQDLATEHLMRMFRFDERWVLNDRGMLRNASQGYFGLGLLPLQMREIHMGLVSNPDDTKLVGALHLSLTEFERRTAVLKILEDLERRGLLRPATMSLLEELRAEESIIVEETENTENQ